MKTWKPIIPTLLLYILSSAARASSPIEIDLPANSIAYSAQTGKLYATIPSSAGIQYGNRVIEISPDDGAIAASVFVGSEPDPIAVSPDAAVAYIGLDGAASALPVTLSPLSAGTAFALGSSNFYGPYYAGQIAVMPGSPDTVAVSRIALGVSPDYMGTAIFDNGVMRPTVDNTFSGAGAIAFGSDPATLYGYNHEDTGFDLYRFAIDALGISVAASEGNVVSGFNVDIIADGDTIYSTSGKAVDGSLFQILGTYSVPSFGGPVLLDKANGAVIFAVANAVDVFDQEFFIQTYSEAVPTAGNPKSATTCGSACVAVVYDSNQIFILHDVSDEIFANGFE